MDIQVSLAPGVSKTMRQVQDGSFSDIVSVAPQKISLASFSKTGVNLDGFFYPPVQTGSMSFSQSSGNLVIEAGIVPNSEFLARSQESFSGSMRMRASIVSSQRIINSNFSLILADLIGEGLSYSSAASTSVVVNFPEDAPHKLTSANVGQFVFLGAITGAGGIPGRYAISQVPSPTTLVFSVSGWAIETGTLTLFGRNHIKTVFSGATATSFIGDAQGEGFASGDTTVTSNTTQSPGTIIQVEAAGCDVFWLDSLRASSGSFSATSRASRIENLPAADVPLYLFLWAVSGSTAPVSSTVWTTSFVSIEEFTNLPVYLQGIRPTGQVNPLQVSANLGATSNLVGDTGLQYRATTTGAASVVSVLSPATPAIATVKGSAGKLIGLVLQNSSAALRSVKLFNATAPSLGTTAALFEVDIPAGETVNFTFDGGIGFSTAITYAVTGAKGLTNNTGGLGANDVSGIIVFA